MKKGGRRCATGLLPSTPDRALTPHSASCWPHAPQEDRPRPVHRYLVVRHALYLSAPYVTEFNANGIVAGKFGSHLPFMSPTASSWQRIGNSSSACRTTRCSKNSSRRWEGRTHGCAFQPKRIASNPADREVNDLGGVFAATARKAGSTSASSSACRQAWSELWGRWPATCTPPLAGSISTADTMACVPWARLSS